MSEQDVTDAQLQRLAEAVKRRTAELRQRTDAEIKSRGGPSNSTMTKIRHARRPVSDRSTLEDLDRGLDWEIGSAWDLLHHGREPRPLAADESGGDDRRAVLRVLRAVNGNMGGPLRKLVQIRKDLDEIIAELSELD